VRSHSKRSVGGKPLIPLITYSLKLKVVLADNNDEKLKIAEKELQEEFGEQSVIAIKTDVSKLEDVERLKDKVFEMFGEVSIHQIGRYSPPKLSFGFSGQCFDEQCWYRVLQRKGRNCVLQH
jgi:hypothetical protein